MEKIDAKDKRILEILQQDANTTIEWIAAKLRLTKSPVYERIKRLNKTGIIKKYVAVVAPEKIESAMVVFCSVSLDSQKLETIKLFGASVEKIPEVTECYLMGGSYDFLLKVLVKDLEAYHEFSSGKLAALPNVSQISSTFVLNEVKRSTVVPIF